MSGESWDVSDICRQHWTFLCVSNEHMGVKACTLPHTYSVALFPGAAKLSVACSTEKRGEPGIFSHITMMYSENGEIFRMNRLRFVYC